MRSIAILCSAVMLFLSGCGTPGAPQPPSLRLPRPVDDLAAIRKGDRVILTWTPPTQTTDKENIRTPGMTHVCRAVARFPIIECGSPIASLGPDDGAVIRGDPPKKAFEDHLPEELQRANATEFATYALEVLNARGRSAGASNQVRVPLAPALEAPPNVKADVRQDGIRLSWDVGTPEQRDVLNYSYRIYRREPGARGGVPMAAVPLSGSTVEYVDRSFEWEKAYEYWVTGVTQVRHGGLQIADVEGEDSPVVKVLAEDTFAPAQPSGVQAVFSGPGQKPAIDLTWAPNLDADLAGYNVYRRTEGTQPVKINAEPVRAPSFRDAGVEPGTEYFYSVSGVDLRGNQSERSAEASERTATP